MPRVAKKKCPVFNSVKTGCFLGGLRNSSIPCVFKTISLEKFFLQYVLHMHVRQRPNLFLDAPVMKVRSLQKNKT